MSDPDQEAVDAWFAKRASQIARKKEMHDTRYSSVVEKLAELGINPRELRDYLAGLVE